MSEENAEITAESELADIISQIDSAVDEAGIEPQENSSNDEVGDTDELGELSDDSTDVEGSEEESGESTEESSEISDGEAQARDKGWRPKEEFEGDEKDWVDYGEFNRRTELFDKISSQNKTIKSLNKKLDALIDHNKGLAERTREKTIAELEAKRKEAVKYGDEDSFNEADEELKKIEKEEIFPQDEEDTEDEANSESKEPELPSEVKNALSDFSSKNPWFEKDKEMTDFMVFKTQQIINNEGINLIEALPKAEAEVKKVYAAKFSNPNKKKPSSVMQGSRENRGSKKTISSLTPEQKQVWHTLKGVMSEKEFLDQLGD